MSSKKNNAASSSDPPGTPSTLYAVTSAGEPTPPGLVSWSGG